MSVTTTQSSSSPSSSTISSSTSSLYWAVARLGYFGSYFGLSGISPYVSVFLEQRGFRPSEVGYVTASQPLCLLLLLTPISYIADRYHAISSIALFGVAVSTISLALSTWSSSAPWISFWMVLYFVVSTPIEPFLDKHVMVGLLPPSERGKWASARVWGAYGWGIGAPLAAYLIGQFGWETVPVLMVGLGRLCSAIAFSVRNELATVEDQQGTDNDNNKHGENAKKVDGQQAERLSYYDVLLFVAAHRRLLLFLICVCCMGTGYVFIATYLFLFLKELGAPDVLLGLSISLTVVVEVPLFLHAEQLHARFCDRTLFTAAAVGWGIRVVGYSFLTNPWVVLLLEPLHGCSFGLMWLAGVNTVRHTFPKNLATTAFGFLHASAFGVGPLIGNIIGGFL